jgi:[glutamine synthetase] adenylyltransferase / [glutamine synthetase]-adenylyl-L-tyrosine phosphorylase
VFKTSPLGDFETTLEKARAVAPYLDRLCRRRPETYEALAQNGPADVVSSALEKAKASISQAEDVAMATLRQAKSDVHLACAVGDLMGVFSLEEVTKALSDLADIATNVALILAARGAPSRDRAAFSDPDKVPGLFFIAMGKHGAHELNYSSDIDLAAFYDRDAFGEDYQDSASGICVRIVQAVSRILEDVTPDGYVFRVDWRLRPDPASTPVAVSLRAAEAYYESVGQNWERAAFIKARVIAGDEDAAKVLIDHLRPFIWRKNLDFAAIDDVQSILRQIHAVRRSTDLDDPAFDVKLGRGGIREIEFFVQTQQLILGGRDPSLRGRRTLESLDDLVAAGRISSEVCDDLARGYQLLRAIEHRIQMLDDEQTHKLPADPVRRARVAVLAGHKDVEELDRQVRTCRELVRTRVRELFPESAALSSDLGSLVFTGVDDDPETLETLKGFGFKAPSRVAKAIRSWHHGHIPATRTARARELLTALTPGLLQAISTTGEPDQGFARFQDFFAALPAGVQVMSLFKAEPDILRETCATLALAPRLGEALAKRPAILDAMMSQRFAAPLHQDAAGARLAVLSSALAGSSGFEESLDLVRRAHRDEAYRIGFQVLHGRAKAQDAGPAYSDLAEATISALLPVAHHALEAAHGRYPSRVAVCAWGKLGGREIAADSDLDLMIVYDLDDAEAESNGPRPLSAEQYHTRLTQRLVSALSAQTAEGTLYEVDMQLRPSGTKGPVAVRFSALANYYNYQSGGQAWTWEYQALTRLRPVAGDPVLCAQIEVLAKTALAQQRDEATTITDIVAMRAKMVAAHPARGSWDIKRQRGGLIDLEFLVQAYQLLATPKGLDVVRANTLEALGALADAGELDRETAGRLIHAGGILHDIRQLLAVASGPGFDPDSASLGLKSAIARALNAPDFASASAILSDARAVIAKAWEELAARATE